MLSSNLVAIGLVGDKILSILAREGCAGGRHFCDFCRRKKVVLERVKVMAQQEM